MTTIPALRFPGSLKCEAPDTLNFLCFEPQLPQTCVAQRVSQVVSAWHLVYQQYLATGLISPHPYQIHTVPQAIHRGTTVITKEEGGSVQGTISCYLDGCEGLPLDTVYPHELALARAQNPQLGEIGLFAEHECESNRTVHELFDFMRYPVYALYHQQVSQILIGVHPRHATFYSRLLGFEVAGPVRRYKLVQDHPVVLLRFDPTRLDATDPAPRGLRYWRNHRLSAAVFEQRLDFDADEVETSILHRYLRWLHRRDAGPIRLRQPSENEPYRYGDDAAEHDFASIA